MKKKINYWDAQTKGFIASFKNIPKKNFFYSALFDFLTILALFIIIYSSLLLVSVISLKVAPSLADAYVAKLVGDSEAFAAAMEQAVPALNKLMFFSLIIFIIGFVLGVFFFSWFNGVAWRKALRKKPDKFFMKEYLKLNFIWFIIWLAIMLFTSLVFITKIAAVLLLIEIILFLYFDFILRSLFNEKKTIRENIKSLFRIAKCFWWFIPPFIAWLIVFIILLLVLNLFTNITPIFFILFFIFILFLIGWGRLYVIEIVKRLLKLKLRM